MTLRSMTILIAALLAIPASMFTIATAEGERVEDVTIRSFDDTTLAATLFVPADADETNPAPFVLMTHGWAGSRQTSLTGRVADLVGAGYGVLTWDSRGFGASGGEVMLNDPSFEGRDVSAIIDWLVVNAPVAKVNGDPVIGMSGGSYAGGIQLLAAAFDDRIDVIAPEITWNDLAQSLAPNDVIKAQWISLLFGAGQATSCSQGNKVSVNPSGCQTTALARYYATVMATNEMTPEVKDALLRRSPATYMANIDVPTLVIQGFPDTLFDVDQAIANYEGVKANGAPVKLWLYDGGHAGPGTQSSLISPTVVAWFDCHLALVADCTNVGPEIEYYAGGEWHTATAWPPAGTAGSAALSGIPPLMVGPAPTGSQGQWVIDLVTAAEDEKLQSVTNVGITLDASTSAPTGAVLHAALGVRSASGAVTRVDGQTQPVRVLGGGSLQSITLDLVDVAATVNPGETLVMTLSTGDAAYNNARSVGHLYMKNVVATYETLAETVPVVITACGSDDSLDDGLATTGLAMGLHLESEWDALGALASGITGTAIVTRDGERLANAFIQISVSRDTWVSNVGREQVLTGVTNEYGALCFAVPTAFSIPGSYSVAAEASNAGDYVSDEAAYTVG